MQKDIYLKLHSADDNSPLIINSAEIVYINVSEEDKITTIYTMSDEEERQCNEQPDKIFNQISSTAGNPNGFIRVHRQTDNTIEYFNISYFIACEIDEDSDTIISLQNMIQMCVNETPQKIYNAMLDAFGAPDNGISSKLNQENPQQEEPQQRNKK